MMSATWWAGATMSRPLYQLKAEFFKTLGHPVRIRVLELLSEREHAVSELLAAIEIEPANLSQQLAVLRRAGLVTTRK
jgi:DNA-binding transcriptional ArsR family regulator